jgi:hypothetical protein
MGLSYCENVKQFLIRRRIPIHMNIVDSGIIALAGLQDVDGSVGVP